MRACLAAVLAAAFGGILAHHAPVAAAPAATVIRWISTSDAPAAATAVVEGLPAEALEELAAKLVEGESLLSIFPVRTVAGETAGRVDLPPMSGTYRVVDKALQFQPRYLLEPEVPYRAEYHPDELSTVTGAPPPVSGDYSFDKTPPAEATRVTKVFPTDDELPANLLKFYLYFSAPMRRGGVLNFIELLDEAGAPVELPFLDLAEELWNPAQTRLTLLIDPGRIKRGLRPNQELGPVLEEGKSYTLKIHREWLDSVKSPLRKDFRKRFKVTKPDRQPPDPALWKVVRPAAETREELIYIFDEPLDHAVVGRLFTITDGSVWSIPGAVRFSNGERKLYFKPDQPWRRTRYQVHIPHEIEDIVGNRVGRPFDLDLFDRTEPLTSDREDLRSFDPK